VGGGFTSIRNPPGLKPVIDLGLRGAEAPLFHVTACIRFTHEKPQDVTTESVSPRAGSDLPFYVAATLAGIGTGWVDVMIDDLLFTALLVLMACMLLGLLRPRWPWRWVLVVGVFVPLAELAAYLILTVKPTRAQVYGSFLASLPGIAGAYGGALMRGVIDNLRQGK
jgi:hypothetical protein